MRRRSSLSTIDEDFGQIDLMLRELRNRIADAAEAVHVAREEADRAILQRARARASRVRSKRRS